MKNIGDFTPGKTVICRFCTHKADGTPATLSGTPAISVYKNSTTESTSGVTLTVDYDGRTGLNHVAIDTSADGTFYAAGSDFDIVITTGTVDSISVVGTVVGTFSLSNRSALRPTTADRTFDVSAAGKAPATVAAGDIANDAITAAAIANGAIDAATFAAGAIDAAAIATDAIGSAELAASAVTEIQSGLSTLTAAQVWDALLTGITTAGSVGRLIKDFLDAAITSRMVSYTQPTGFLAATFPGTVASPTNITAGTIANLTNLPAIPANWLTAAGIAAAALNGKGDWLLSSGYTAPDNAGITAINAKTTNLPADPADASDIAASFGTVNTTLATIAGYVDTEVGAIKAKTDNLPAVPAAQSDCLTAAGVRAAVGLAAANLDAQLAALVGAGVVRPRKNVALPNFPFRMTDAVTHAPAPLLTVTATRRLDGGAFAPCANAVTAIASGWYTIDLAASDLNGDTVALRFTATGADDGGLTILTQP